MCVDLVEQSEKIMAWISLFGICCSEAFDKCGIAKFNRSVRCVQYLVLTFIFCLIVTLVLLYAAPVPVTIHEMSSVYVSS